MVKGLLPRGVTDWAVIAAMAVIALAIGAWVLLPSGGSGDTDAWTACKSAVTGKLANPATADFKISASRIDESDTGHQVSGQVRAQNAFGVPSDFYFRCDVDESGAVTRSDLTPTS